MIRPYDHAAALLYAHRWAYRRNPLFYDYEELGGDCTSFISQCVLAGSGIMNYTPTFGWYYVDGNDKSPSWSGVPYFYNFMVRQQESIGPFAAPCTMEELLPGDVIQLSFDGLNYAHSLFVVATAFPLSPRRIFVATHSADADYRPLSSYGYQRARGIHFRGVRWP